MHALAYTAFFYAIPVVCELLEAAVLWRLSRRSAPGSYPYIRAYLYYDFARTPLLLIVRHFGRAAFPWFYWFTDVPAQLLHFLILWEVARSLFLPKSSIRRIAWNTLLIVQLVLVPAIVFLCWYQATLVRFPAKSVASVFEQYTGLAQALLLLMIAAVARYYRIVLGRNMRGLIFSLGAYLLVDSLSFAGYQIFGAARPYIQLLPGAIFTAMIAVWLWGFWEFAPPKHMAIADHADLAWKHTWNQMWETTITTVRRRPS